MTSPRTTPQDNDLKKGAVEDQPAGEGSMNSMSKQLGQRDRDPQLADYDSIFPKPPLATS